MSGMRKTNNFNLPNFGTENFNALGTIFSVAKIVNYLVLVQFIN